MRLHALHLFFLALVTLPGCAWITDAEETARYDVDGDKIPRPLDCNDDDRTVGEPTLWYRDVDEDGYGDPSSTLESCDPEPGYVAQAGDCNDADASIHPDAIEICNELDDDCSGTPDDNLQLLTYYLDSDGDSFGDPNRPTTTCAPPTGHVQNPDDCNDGDPAINPDADEVCDGVDNNCSGFTDDPANDTIDPAETHWYPDRDGDTYGDSVWDPAAEGTVQCDMPPGPTAWVHDATDCADEPLPAITAPAPELINPGMPEICDGFDNNCVSGTDEDAAIDASTWYLDGDGDGFGDFSAPQNACTRPFGRVANFTDCDDSNALVNPSAAEICDGGDNDCDSLTDDADPETVDQPSWYFDGDGDGFGDASFSTVTACAAPPSFVAQANDCDDADPDRNPGAAEICDGIDNDCDDKPDEADPDISPDDLLVWYQDADRDGYGNPVQTAIACVAPPLHVDNGDDCNDFDRQSYPGAVEKCDALDNDCDGDSDEGIIVPWYKDSDGDGYGISTDFIDTCNPGPDRVTQAGDCDDNDANNFPNNDEFCDGVDNDCDDAVDEDDPLDLVAAEWWLDADGDGQGDPNSASIPGCTQPPSYVDNDGDCDDSRADVYGTAPELCDGVDNNCNGLVDSVYEEIDPLGNSWYEDSDGDTFGAGEPIVQCTQPLPEYELAGGDCDDDDATVYPTAMELCDGKDNDCDDLIDDEDDPADIDPGSSRQAFEDTDGDGQGDPTLPWPELTCSEPAPGWVFDGNDCDDSNPDVYLDGPELCDGIDNDCDLDIDEMTPIFWYEDSDGDGDGNPYNSMQSCYKPPGFVFTNGDCNDNNDQIYLDAPELCDSIDNDCDGFADDADDDVEGSVWYRDSDDDGYGRNSDTVIACNQPVNDFYSLDGGDCDDFLVSVNPAATEVCDNRDNDCNGLADDSDPGVTNAATWHPDDDGDAYGHPILFQTSCDQPAFHVADNSDCDDTDFKINPGATEVCDTVDNDCNGDIDDDDVGVVDQVTWIPDNDNDNFGEQGGTPLGDFCFDPGSAALNSSDCDDTDPFTFPGAPEQCNGVDNDCDGTADSPTPLLRTWCPDVDGDGWGDGTNNEANCLVDTCDPPAGYVPNSADCNDINAQVGPGNTEICNDGLDNDCDGLEDGFDPIAVGGDPLYRDLDGDGFGDPNDAILACDEPGYVLDDTDCDDTDPTIFPGAPLVEGDVGDGIDRDCDQLDECFLDADGDSFIGNTIGPDDGDGLCTGVGEGLVWDDCHDDVASAFPGAVVTSNSVGDGIDQDCLNGEECFVDSDGDGDGQESPIIITDDDGDGICDGPGESATATDCDSSDPTVYLGAPELCGDGIDNDCDGEDETTDPDVTPVAWYLDTDGDGFGDATFSVTTCEQPQGFVIEPTDCDDSSPYAAQAYPGAPEVCDLIDNDCDGLFDSADADLTGGPCIDQPWFSDDFTCWDGTNVGGFESNRSQWVETNAGTQWMFAGGVAYSESDLTSGTLGGGNDANENYLVVGGSEWRDGFVEATVNIASGEDGAVGLVGRFSNTQSHATCYITNAVTPGCTGVVNVGPRAALAKIDPNNTCVLDDDYTVDSTPYSYPNDTDIRMRLDLTDGTLTCTIDADLDGVLGSGGDIVLTHTDASPLSRGRFGLAAFGVGPLGAFDDVLIDGTDPDLDGDGLTGGANGPDTVDAIGDPDDYYGLGSTDADTDADDDSVSDRDEALNYRFARNNALQFPDTDGDGLFDTVDPDSDDDGWPDFREAGDADLLTPPVDTDCDGEEDLRDEDSDDDGILDFEDLCRTAFDPLQEDADADGLGDACDPAPNTADGDFDGVNDGLEFFLGSNPTVSDTDGDGLDDGEEFLAGTNSLRIDTDADGLTDGDEVDIHGTLPTEGDSDGDGVLDGTEISNGTDPNNPGSF